MKHAYLVLLFLVTLVAPPLLAQTSTSQTFTYSGQIDSFIVPAGVTSLTIEARGAQGGRGYSYNYPGNGAIISGAVSVTPGQPLKILVGQQPLGVNYGGGGSFVTDAANNPLVIAGGGGGSGDGSDSDQKQGQAGTTGGTGSSGGGAGGSDGLGGSPTVYGGGGGGLRGDGGGGDRGGKSFTNGGGGGSTGYGEGGFGGGGLGSGVYAGGGGGGYSGGGGGGSYNAGGVGGGGGSYNAGTNQTNTSGANYGNGLVIISYSLPPSITDLGASPNPVCVSSPFRFTATIGNVSGSYSYTLLAPDGFTDSGTQSGPTFTSSQIVLGPGDTGPQVFTLTLSSNGQQAKASATLMVSPIPVASLNPSGPLTCAQTSVVLVAGGGVTGATYQFTGQTAPTSSSTISVSQADPYSVTVTNPGGCSSTAITTVQSNTATPRGVTLSNDGPLTCSKTSVNLTAGSSTPNVTYTFSGSGVTAQNGNTATANQEGQYTVKVTGTNGCTATQSTQVSSSTAAPTATLSNNGPITANQPAATLTAGGGGTYQFNQGATSQGGGNTATTTTPGTYQVTVTSANGCSATASTVVTGAVSGSSCRNGSGVITVTASGTLIKYEWYRNSINSARLTENPAQVRGTSTSSLTLVNQQATADYYVRVTDANGTAVVYGPFRFTVNTGCNIYARQGAEEVELRISLLGNPVIGDQLKAVISGAEGKALNVQLLDLQGRAVQQQWGQAQAQHPVEWNLGSQSSGIYLLQATTPEQRQSVKVIKQ